MPTEKGQCGKASARGGACGYAERFSRMAREMGFWMEEAAAVGARGESDVGLDICVAVVPAGSEDDGDVPDLNGRSNF